MVIDEIVNEGKEYKPPHPDNRFSRAVGGLSKAIEYTALGLVEFLPKGPKEKFYSFYSKTNDERRIANLVSCAMEGLPSLVFTESLFFTITSEPESLMYSVKAVILAAIPLTDAIFRFNRIPHYYQKNEQYLGFLETWWRGP